MAAMIKSPLAVPDATELAERYLNVAARRQAGGRCECASRFSCRRPRQTRPASAAGGHDHPIERWIGLCRNMRGSNFRERAHRRAVGLCAGAPRMFDRVRNQAIGVGFHLQAAERTGLVASRRTAASVECSDIEVRRVPREGCST